MKAELIYNLCKIKSMVKSVESFIFSTEFYNLSQSEKDEKLKCYLDKTNKILEKK